MMRTAAGVFIVDDWPGDIQQETNATNATNATEETENTCYFFCPMCLKEYRLDTEPGDHHEIFCECKNMVLFGRMSDKSGLVMFLLF